MSLGKVILFMFVMTGLIANASATRVLLKTEPGHNIAARLEASGGLVDCWNALTELRSCSNEIILFFLNGQTSLGAACCAAIETITRNCWPAMLTSLGFTPEEGNILRGYCDASFGPAASPSSSMASH